MSYKTMLINKKLEKIEALGMSIDTLFRRYPKVDIPLSIAMGVAVGRVKVAKRTRSDLDFIENQLREALAVLQQKFKALKAEELASLVTVELSEEDLNNLRNMK